MYDFEALQLIVCIHVRTFPHHEINLSSESRYFEPTVIRCVKVEKYIKLALTVLRSFTQRPFTKFEGPLTHHPDGYFV